MEVLLARDVANMSEHDIWTILPPRFIMRFDDGDMVVDDRRTQMCYYLWWPLRDYPDTKIYKYHHMGAAGWTSKSVLELNDAMWWDCFDQHGKSINPELGAMRSKQEINRLHNSVSVNLGAHVASLDILDFAEVMMHPEIKAINDHLQSLDQTDLSVLVMMDVEIAKAHAEVTRIMMTCPTLKDNRLVCAVRAKTSDINPVLQIICCRGKPTDIDSTVFTTAIVRGLGHGLFSLYDVLAESRTAAKALELQKDPLADTEYFNRQMQLICATLAHLDAYWQRNVEGPYELHDCGTKRYITWQVDKQNFQDLVGSYRVDENDQLQVIRKDDVHLIGTVIQIRNGLTCAHPEENHICAACYGELEFSLPAGTNVAHFACIVLCAIISQKVLSVKHNETSATVAGAEVPREYRRQLRALGNSYGFSLDLDLSTSSLAINKDDVPRLSDIYETKNIHDLPLRKIGTMQDVTIISEIPGLGLTSSYVPVRSGTTGSSFTYEFLEYIKATGFEVERETIIINLKDWDIMKPVWEMSRKHANMLDFMEAIKKLVKVSDDDKTTKLTMDLDEEGNVSLALSGFYDLVRSKFPFNLSLLGVIMRSTLVVDKELGDYRIPCGDQIGQFEQFGKTMEKRSLGGGLANERHEGIFVNPDSYILTERGGHPLDETIQPTMSYFP